MTTTATTHEAMSAIALTSKIERVYSPVELCAVAIGCNRRRQRPLSQFRPPAPQERGLVHRSPLRQHLVAEVRNDDHRDDP